MSTSSSPSISTSFTDSSQIGLNFALFELIQLVGNHRQRAAVMAHPGNHGHIVGGGFVPGVDDHINADDIVLIGGEILVDQPGVTVTLLFGCLGITVTGQVDEPALFVHLENR